MTRPMRGGPVIEARDFSVHLGSRRLLHPVTFTVEPGEAALLTGPNGSGKSTLLRALAGLLPPEAGTSGSLRVDGADPLGGPGAAARIGIVLQHAEHQLLGLTVEEEVRFKLENLRVPAREGLPKAGEALARFGLDRLASRESAHLSGGEAKRAVLAQQLAPGPPLLLLDEPLASLDRAGREGLLAALQPLRGEVTLVIAEHEPGPLLPLVDRVLALGGNPPSPRAVASRRPGSRATGPIRIRVEDLTLAPAVRAPPVVEGATFALPEGLHVLQGANGSGKTTILRALAGLAAPAAGRLLVDGIPATGGPHALAAAVGYLPQEAEDFLTESTVAEEIALAPRLLGLPAPDPGLAADFGLTGHLGRHPLSMSGGERQRVALAAALAHRPRVLLLDEPTLHLDGEGAAALLLHLERFIAAGGAVLAATHSDALAAAADTRLLLERGRITVERPALEVVA